MRAWIEIEPMHMMSWYTFVALFMRAWIEMEVIRVTALEALSRPLHEGVD